jgi:hypothetical protein
MFVLSNLATSSVLETILLLLERLLLLWKITFTLTIQDYNRL